jgi:RNA-directed DNA polymerase
MNETKPFCIEKQRVMESWERVKANGGTYGVDEESIKEFELNLKDNLFKVWNRMSSGSYFPPAVRGVEIEKKDGGQRMLGIPTIVS